MQTFHSEGEEYVTTLAMLLNEIRPVIPLTPEPLAGTGDFQRCSVCDGYWRPWAGSRLPCHARCLYSEVDQDELLRICEVPSFEYSVSDVARHLGVTLGILTASTRQAINRRSERDRLKRMAAEDDEL